MMAAGLLAKKAVEKGLRTPPWVKTSLAPGSRVVTDYYVKAGLMPYLDKLRFQVVGYGCTTCIGNSGPLPTDVSQSHRRPQPRRRLRPLRQSQLRRPHLRRGPRQLPHEPPARRRLRPRRHHQSRLRHRAHRLRPRPPARHARRHLAHPERSRRHRPLLHRRRHVHSPVLHRLRWRPELAKPHLPLRRHLRLGARLHLHPQSPLLRRHARHPR